MEDCEMAPISEVIFFLTPKQRNWLIWELLSFPFLGIKYGSLQVPSVTIAKAQVCLGKNLYAHMLAIGLT